MWRPTIMYHGKGSGIQKFGNAKICENINFWVFQI